MDSISQAVLGGCIQGSILGKQQGRKAYVYGALLGTLPDLDVLIQYANPIDAMTHHRGFSHSLFILTALAALIVFLIQRFKRQKNIPIPRLFLAIWLVLITHALLDAFTNYGTQLFWPLEITPISWASIFIIDPVFTLPLLLAFVFGIIKKSHLVTQKVSIFALFWSCIYLGLGQWSQAAALNKAQQQMASADINITRMKAMATPVNILLWQILAEDNLGRRYEIISHSLDGKPAEYRQLPNQLKLVEQNADIKRLNWFSDNWTLLSEQDNQLILQDLRMGSAGQYFFGFIIAQKENNQWQFSTPARYKVERKYSLEEMFLMLWQRLTQGKRMAYASWQSAS